MTNHGRFGRVLAVGALGWSVAGCATLPPGALDRAREAHASAASDEAVARNAPEVLYEASKDLDAAERAWEERDETRVEHLAYLAELRVERARVLARKRLADQEAAELTRQRERTLLEARTREVDLARVEAELARGRAEQEASRAAELAGALDELKAQRTDRGIIVTLGDVLFAFGRADLEPGTRQNLVRLASALRQASDRELIVEGHTDSVGSESFNTALAQRRAEAVRSFLLESGVAPARVVAQGYGEAYPVATNETPEGRQRNRRVEVVILEPGQIASEQLRLRKLPAVGAQR